MDDINEMFKNFGFGFNKKDMDDIFSGGFADFFSEDFGRSQVQKGKDIHTNLSINFKDSIKGVNKVLNLNRPDTCSTCSGSKMKPGTSKSTCQTCRGTGRVAFQRGPMFIQQTCSSCGGMGEKISHPCQTCRGTGMGTTNSTVEIKVPAGISDGQSLRMGGKGYPGRNGGMSGDL